MHSATYAMVRCPSVCPSIVMFLYSIAMSKHNPQTFSPSGSAILVSSDEIAVTK